MPCIFTKHNFHNNTFCIWKEVQAKEISNKKIQYCSKSGSSYIFSGQGVYRISNHWGRVSNCRWRLIPINNYKNQNRTIAYASWNDFLPNDESAKLFYLSVDFDKKQVHFDHVGNSNYDGKAVARNAIETTKRMQLISEIFKDVVWSKYLRFSNYEVLQKEIIDSLVNGNKSWLEIKKEYLQP